MPLTISFGGYCFTKKKIDIYWNIGMPPSTRYPASALGRHSEYKWRETIRVSCHELITFFLFFSCTNTRTIIPGKMSVKKKKKVAGEGVRERLTSRLAACNVKKRDAVRITRHGKPVSYNRLPPGRNIGIGVATSVVTVRAFQSVRVTRTAAKPNESITSRQGAAGGRSHARTCVCGSRPTSLPESRGRGGERRWPTLVTCGGRRFFFFEMSLAENARLPARCPLSVYYVQFFWFFQPTFLPSAPSWKNKAIERPRDMIFWWMNSRALFEITVTVVSHEEFFTNNIVSC